MGELLSPHEAAELSKLNPEKFYLENVRSLLGVSAPRAQRICEVAVRQGLFKPGIEVLAPDGAVVASADQEADLPKTIHFWLDQNGHHEEAEADTNTLPKKFLYRLIADDPSPREQHHT